LEERDVTEEEQERYTRQHRRRDPEIPSWAMDGEWVVLKDAEPTGTGREEVTPLHSDEGEEVARESQPHLNRAEEETHID